MITGKKVLSQTLDLAKVNERGKLEEPSRDWYSWALRCARDAATDPDPSVRLLDVDLCKITGFGTSQILNSPQAF